ncbi:SDR family NAD(P)-dependent oxidoreductase [Bacillus cereus]|uniref:SDR family NAD(P)-dependent oxidoreductase n=1 Tax=Bacillus cereus TaxID=1396 RepID=UPI003CFEAF6A
MTTNEASVTDILMKLKKGELSSVKAFEYLKELKKGVNPDGPEESNQGLVKDITINQSSHKSKSHDRTKDIAVIGMSGRFPGADNLNQFWDNLQKGVNSIIEVPADRWDAESLYDPHLKEDNKSNSKWGGFLEGIDLFDPQFFNISPKEAELMDPQQRLFLQEAWNAFEDAGYSDNELNGKACGVFVGHADGDYRAHLNKQKVPKDSYYFTGNSGSILASRISYFLNLKGPSMSIDTACSSSLVALSLACESINSGACEMAIAGGVTLLTTPQLYLLAGKSGMLSSDGQCKTFDDKADGFVPSEGVGAVVLKSLESALADGDNIHGVIKGYSINQDGKTNGITAPSATSQTALQQNVYDRFDIHPETIGYVEAHGTGTKLGDPIEIDALTDAFGTYTNKLGFCAIGSVKSNIGHTQLASGVASLIKLLLCLKNKKLVPSINFNQENQHINFMSTPFYMNTDLKDWDVPGDVPRRGAVSAFGFSGTNAHIVVEEASENLVKKEEETQESCYFIPISAKTESALRQKYKDLARWIDKKGHLHDIKDVAFTLLNGRSQFAVRSFLVVSDMEDLRKQLDKSDGNYMNETWYRNLKEKPVKIEDENITLGNNLIRQLSDSSLVVLQRRRLLADLGELYVQGYELRYNALYSDSKHQRVSLPTYPFDLERYWLPLSRGANEPASLIKSNLHPLVGSNTSTLYEQTFTTTLNENDFFLKDHVVNGEHVLPGVAYMEMARVAGELSGQRKVQKFENIVWSKPVVITSGELDVCIGLYPNDKNMVRYEVFSLGEGGERTLHSQGQLIYEPDGDKKDFARTINIEEICARCPYERSKVEHYSHFISRGMLHGPAMQAVVSLHTGDMEALAKIELPSVPVDQRDQYVIHPALMDGVLQSVIGVVGSKQEDTNQIYLPFSLESIHIHAVMDDKCYAHARLSESYNNKELKYDITVTNSGGEIIMEILGFCMRKVGQSVRPEVKNLLLHGVWEKAEPISPTTSDGRPIVLFDYDTELGNRLRDHSKDKVVIVKASDSFRVLGKRENRVYEINPDTASDYAKLLEMLTLEYGTPRMVLYLWGTRPETNGPFDLDGSLDKAIYPFFHLTKAFMQKKLIEPVQLIFLHERIHERSNPLFAAVDNFAKTIAMESQKLRIKSLEIRKPVEIDVQFFNTLLSELDVSREQETAVRYDEEGRWTHNLRIIDQFPDLEQPLQTSAIRNKGVYVVTGGAGELGFHISMYLAERYHAKIILSGRSPMSLDIQANVNKVNEVGGEAIYIQSDVSSLGETKELIRQAKSRFKHINGVIHCAGLTRDSLMWKKSESDWKQVLKPKVQGSMYLDEATKTESLDFFAMFSSITSVLGNAGQCDYTFANGFLNYFAEFRETQRKLGDRHGKTVSINWPLWQEGGMAPNSETLSLLEKNAGISALPTSDGIRAFEEALVAEGPLFFLLRGETEKIRNLISRDSDHHVYMELGEDFSMANHLATLRMDFGQIIAQQMKLKTKNIQLYKEMGEYGFDSLGLTELSNRINDIYGTDIMPSIFFEYPTLESLTNYMMSRYGDEIGKHYHTSSNPINDIAPSQTGTSEQIPRASLMRDTFPTNNRKVESEGELDTDTGQQDPVAIIGMSGIMPDSPNLDVFWNNLERRNDMVREIPEDRWDWRKLYGDPTKEPDKTNIKWGGFIDDVDKFDALFFGISPREAERMDPQQRIFLETVWSTIEDAGYKASDFSGSQTGLFVGVSTLDYATLLTENEIEIDGYTTTGRAHSVLANRISYLMNFHGPSEPIDTACSSALVAITRAVESIQNGNCETAIAGGVNVMVSPELYIAFSKAGMLAPDGKCKAFDKNANGYVRGEGSGAVLLKPLSKAIQDGDHVYGVIKGAATNHGGRANSLTAPNPNAQAELLIKAYQRAEIDPATVSYIEAHGTGTRLGDPVEINGLKKAFEELYRGANKSIPTKPHCLVGSVKTNIGHLEAAAGIAGIFKVLLAMKNKTIPANINLTEINPYIQLEGSPFKIATETVPWDTSSDENQKKIPRRAGVSSFGYGGANAHVILEEYVPMLKPNANNNRDEGPYVFILSARDEERLKAYAMKMIAFLNKHIPGTMPSGSLSLDDLEHKITLEVSRIVSVNYKEIDPDDSLHDYGFSQTEIITLINRLNDRFDLSLSGDQFTNNESVKDITLLLGDNCDFITRTSSEDNLSMSDLSYTLQMGREAMDERIGIISHSLDELIGQLDEFLKGNESIKNVFRGNREEGDVKDHINSGADNDDYLKYLTENKEYRQLVKLWVSGVDVDWSTLYSDNSAKRIPLPTYPFARDRYWFPMKKSLRQKKHSKPALHPLIDVNESTIEKVTFNKDLLPDEFFVKDHNIGGQTILPGVGYLEMARAAAELAGKKTVSVLKDIVWSQPIDVGDVAHKVQVDVSPSGNGVGYRIYSQQDGSDIIHSEGKLEYANPVSRYQNIDPPVRFQIQDIINRCYIKRNKEEAYSAFREIGFHYGPSFNVMEEVYGGDAEAIAKLNIPDSYHEEFQDYFLHIPLLDGALQTVMGLGNKEVQNDKTLYIPFSLGRLEILKPLPKSCYAYVQLNKNKNNVNSGIRKFNIRLLDEQGEELVRFIDFTSRAVKEQQKRKPVEKNEELYYEEVWKKEAVPTIPSNIKDVIIFARREDKFAQLQSEWSTKQSIRVILVEQGDSYRMVDSNRFVINPGVNEHYEELFRNLKQQQIQLEYIIQCWGCDASAIMDYQDSNYVSRSVRVFENSIDIGLLSIMHIFQTLTRMNQAEKTKILFVYRDHSDIGQPQFEAVAGFARSITPVNPNFSLSAFSLDTEAFQNQSFSELLLNEIRYGTLIGDSLVKIDKNERYVRRIIPFNLTEPTHKGESISIKREGTYLITGGLGSLGMIISKHLAEKYKVNLVITGRGDLNEEKQKQLDELTTLGAKVYYKQADIAKISDVQEVIESTRNRFGRINGIIHAAGLSGTEIVTQVDRESFKQPLNAKVYGTLNLDLCTRDENLDFMVFFSSVAAWAGDFGACSYASSNSFLDGYAKMREQVRALGVCKGITLSIGWPLWENGSMKLPEVEADRYSETTGMVALQNEQGIKMFEQMFSTGKNHLILTVGDSAKISRVLGVRPHVDEQKNILEVEDIKKPVAYLDDIVYKNANNQSDLIRKTEKYLKECLSATAKLPVEKISSRADFDTYGIDSVMISELNRLLEENFESLPRTLFFEYSNVKSLTEYFIENHAERMKDIIFGKKDKEPLTEYKDNNQHTTIQSENLIKKTEAYLKALISTVTKIPESKIRSNASFENYGIDSVMISELSRILDEDFDSIPRTLFFEYSDLKSLTLYFVENHTYRLNEILETNVPDVKDTKVGSMPIDNVNSKTDLENTRKEITVSREPTGQSDLEITDIAIIGVSGKYPMADTVDQFYENLMKGKDCIEEIPDERWDFHEIYDSEPGKPGKSISKWGGFITDIDKFDPFFFSIIPRVATMMDPQERIFLESAWSAIEDAGYTPEQLQTKGSGYRQNDVGVFVGIMYDDYKMIEAEEFLKGNLDAMTGYWNAPIANRVSYALNFRGPSVVIDTACSSSLTAIHMACESIQRGECRTAVAGGVNLSIHPSKYIRLSQLGMVSKDGKCRSFGEGGSGYVPGEGVGSILLKPLREAERDGDQIYAVIKGSTTNHGGKTNGFSVPNPNAQSDLIIQAIEKTGIDPRTISYMECHGTGTALGDPIEVTGLTKGFRRYTKDNQYCSIGSVKSNIGHCEGAAGIVAVTKTMLQLKHKVLFPSLHSERLNPLIDFKNSPFYVQQELKEWKKPVLKVNGTEEIMPRRAGVSSFGAGGSNAHIIMEEYIDTERRGSSYDRAEVVVISAKKQEQLQNYISNWKEYMERNIGEDVRLMDLAFTSQTGRVAFEHRFAVVASTKTELLEKLRSFVQDGVQLDGVFMGEVTKTDMEDNEQLLAFADKQVSNRNMDEIAKLWISGVPIDFFRLFETENPRRTSIPSYPFARNSYWIPVTKNTLIRHEPEPEPEPEPKPTLSPRFEEIRGQIRIDSPELELTKDVQLQVNSFNHGNSAQILKDEIQNYLKDILGEVIQMDPGQIESEIGFAEYGIDSISITQFSKEILKKFPEMSETALFAYQTIAELADYMLESHREKLEDLLLEERKEHAGERKVEIDSSIIVGNPTQSESSKVIDLYEPTSTFLGKVLANVIQGTTDDIEPSVGFAEYGIDSISIGQFSKEIIKALPSVSETALYAYQTIDELTEYMVENYGEELTLFFGIEQEDSKLESEVSFIQNEMDEEKPRISSVNTQLKRNITNDEGNEDIAIIGVAGKFPEAENMDEFWNNLLEGRDSTTEVPKDRWPDMDSYYDPDPGKEGKSYCKWGGFIRDIDKFDPLFFNISPKEAEILDPQERLFLQAAWNVLEDAGYTKDNLLGNDVGKYERNIGVYTGVTTSSYNLIGIEERMKGNEVFTGLSFPSIANRVSYTLNLNGPSMPVDTMCSSSLVAIQMACESIKKGECKLAIAGGVNIYSHPSTFVNLSRMKLVSQDGRTRSFGEGGTGFVPGEGVGAILLKPLKEAERDGDNIYAVIKGGAVTHSGRTNGYFVPNPEAQAALINKALSDARVSAESISYIEAMAVGSETGDAIEIDGLSKVFSKHNTDNSIVISSVKPNIGHAEAASGMAQLMKVLLQMKYKTFVPSLYADQENHRIKLSGTRFHIQKSIVAWNRRATIQNGKTQEHPRRAGISSFGAGGTGAHIIIEEYEKASEISGSGTNKQLIVLSAKSEQLLQRYAVRLRDSVKRTMVNEEVDPTHTVQLSEIAYTLQVGRQPFNERLGLIVSGKMDLLTKLERFIEGQHNHSIGIFCGESVDSMEPQLKSVKAGDTSIYDSFAKGDLNKVARYWVAGGHIDWNAMHTGNKIRRVSLPTYPFERRRCWVKKSVSPVSIMQPAGDNNNFDKEIIEVVAENDSFIASQELVEQTIQGVKQAINMMAPYLSMTIIQYLKGKGVFKNGERVEKDQIYTAIDCAYDKRYMIDALIKILHMEGFVNLEGIYVTLTEKVLSESADTLSNNMKGRKELLQRAFPEFEQYLELVESINKHYDLLLSDQYSMTDIPVLNYVDDIRKISKGENRLSSAMTPFLEGRIEEFLRKKEQMNHTRIKVKEYAPPSSFIRDNIISVLSKSDLQVDYHCVAPDGFRNTVKQLFPVNRSAHANISWDEQKRGDQTKYDILVMHRSYMTDGDRERTLAFCKDSLADEGILIIAQPVEATFYTLILGALNKSWCFVPENDEETALFFSQLASFGFKTMVNYGPWLVIVEKDEKSPQSSQNVENVLSLEQENTYQVVQTMLAGLLGVTMEELDKDCDFQEYGVTSITMTKLYSLLVEKYGSIIEPKDIIECSTIENLGNTVLQKTLARGAGGISQTDDTFSTRSSTPTITDPKTDHIDNGVMDSFLQYEDIVLKQKFFVSSKGRRYEYYDGGEGEPLILLTALAFVSTIWKHQVSQFSPKYRVIMPHLPGHGESFHNQKPFTFEEIADELVELMDHLGITTANVVGWCLAGNIAQLVALRHQSRLKTLTLLCTTPADARIRGISNEDLILYSKDPLGTYVLEFQNIFKNRFTDNPMVNQFLQTIQQSHCNVDSEAVMYHIHNLFRFDTSQTLEQVKIPTLIISGKYDITYPPEQVELLHKGIEGSSYFEFEEAGHMPFLSDYELFNKVLSKFLNDHTGYENSWKPVQVTEEI